MVYSLFRCHKCTRWSHPILTFLTFLKLNLVRLQCYLPEISLENDFICWCHFNTDIIVYRYAEFGRNCLKNKLNITHCTECCVGSLLQYSFVYKHANISKTTKTCAMTRRHVKLVVNMRWPLVPLTPDNDVCIVKSDK